MISNELSNRSAMDSRLLSLARKSPDEIAEITGLESRYVAERISHLLESRGWLSDRQEERLLLEEIADLKDDVVLRMKAAGDDTFAATANVALRALKLISERIDSRKKLVDQDIQSIVAAQAKLFAKAFDIALTHVTTSVKQLGEIPQADDIDEITYEGLRLASAELNKHVID